MKYFLCITCNPELQAQLYGENLPSLILIFLPFILIALLTVFYSVKASSFSDKSGNLLLNPEPLGAVAIILGMGAGGFADGIILHQILQFHEMLSARIQTDTVIGKSINMFWDGIFHFFTLLIVLCGIILLWKLLKKNIIHTSGYLFSGGLLTGWAIFNLIEGIINHHILKLHNIKELSAHHEVWNWGFLTFTVLLFISGWMLMKKGNITTINKPVL